MTQTITEHLAIVDAVLDGDLELAVARFDEHLHESLAVVEERTLQRTCTHDEQPRRDQLHLDGQ